ncbi:hypothetical protein FAZ95_25165 [Trinickia violacea]|uniref:Uncharacterized protein n=1 Tax=Trinickia violacea TaxID=2571746 RepID=A0A4P8ITL6_9BURK|nr:hypothetical protein FAZ95_25165 [Trinickia violacea]
MLSAHEIATLLRLRNTPTGAIASTPDVLALQEISLVQRVTSELGEAKYTLTAAGKALLRRLSAAAHATRWRAA